MVGLEVANFFGTINTYRDQLERTSRTATKAGAKLVTITAGEMNSKANYQDFQRYPEVDLALAGDAEATLPSLIEEVKRQLTGDRSSAIEDRGKRLATASSAAMDRARTDASYAWDAVPISSARLAAEVWAQIRTEDWSLVNGALSGWPQRIFNFEKYYQYIGVSGGSGIGYGAPAAVGAALANKKYGRLSVSLQNDGDLMYAPGVLWTAAHHRIPILFVMNNNRAYHEEVMHLQRMAAPPRARHRQRAHRQRDRQPRHRLREAGAEHGMVRGGADCGSEGPGAVVRPRRGRRQGAGPAWTPDEARWRGRREPPCRPRAGAARAGDAAEAPDRRHRAALRRKRKGRASSQNRRREPALDGTRPRDAGPGP